MGLFLHWNMSISIRHHISTICFSGQTQCYKFPLIIQLSMECRYSMWLMCRIYLILGKIDKIRVTQLFWWKTNLLRSKSGMTEYILSKKVTNTEVFFYQDLGINCIFSTNYHNTIIVTKHALEAKYLIMKRSRFHDLKKRKKKSNSYLAFHP